MQPRLIIFGLILSYSEVNMDLRMVKTRLQIKKAFLTLREKLMPEKIKVKDICEVAMINKTTFYNHYTDSNELSNEIDDSAIDKVISSLPEKNTIFENPKAYISGMLQALERESSNLKVVFRGKQEVLCAKLETRLHNLYDNATNDPDDNIRLSFAIGGFTCVVRDYLFSSKKYSIRQLEESTAQLFETLIKSKAVNAKQ